MHTYNIHISGIDYRVHIVGDEVFACEIASDADDYRYAGQTGHSLIIKLYDLPEDIFSSPSLMP